MPPPFKHKDPTARNAARREQRSRYAKSERGKATRSTQNRTAYQRRNGRRGSPVIPYIHPMIPCLAKDPVPLTLMVCLTFHEPKLVISEPLTYKVILGLSKEDSSPTQSDIIHGLYLRYEQDSQDNRMDRFNSGDFICLQRDVGRELRIVLKIWVELWKKEAMKWYHADTTESDDEQDIDLVHLRWISRIADGLRNELFLLGTAQRCQDYVSFIRAHRVEIPNMSSPSAPHVHTIISN